MGTANITNQSSALDKQLLRDKLLDAMAQVAENSIRPNAKAVDQNKAFPKDDFHALHQAELLQTCIGTEWGGHGVNHPNGNIEILWHLTAAVAEASMSTSRCWEGHNNAVILLENIASYEQKERWFKGIIENGDVWTVWSGEPLLKTPGQKANIGTFVEETKDGYIINGSKVFCSSATGATWANILVNTEGAGAARHSTANPESLLMLGCELSDPSITFDDSWWNPIGMRGSVSYKVDFNNTFIPKENLIGFGGQFLTEEWQTRFVPQYASTFFGGARAAYQYTLAHIQSQKREDDPYVQHRIGKMAIHINTMEMWLDQVANLWGEQKIEAAKKLGNMCRYQVEQLAMEVVEHAVHVCGARGLIQPAVLERIVRDITIYTRHDNDDQLLATIGRSCLGQSHDKSFYNTK